MYFSEFTNKYPFSLRGEKVRTCPELDSGMRGDEMNIPSP